MSCKNPDCQCKSEKETFLDSLNSTFHELPEGFEKLTILLDDLCVRFIGKHRPDLHEKSPNWHYYETTDGKIQHFRKDKMICVLEDIEHNGITIGVAE